eukprot:GHVQ01024490.1.p1 GENE.GHVQ01024490.1~~GHVQ01024490.1.p1  ORF type:complete len:206 (-),score=19.01 GHVQ01024490.1:544-1161(-)
MAACIATIHTPKLQSFLPLHRFTHVRSFSNSAPLNKNLLFSDIVRPKWLLEEQNFLRQPLWKQWWEAQFNARTLWILGCSWASLLTVTSFLWWSRVFDPPPPERYDRYWYNSAKFRIISARENPGKRPAHTISLLTYNTRYYHRGLDHPFGLNEMKDVLFKLRENFLIERYPGVQYPYVYRQFNRVTTPGTLKVPVYPLPLKRSH